MTDVKNILMWAAGYAESGWTRDHYARTARGRPCPATSAEAKSWCMVGAVLKARHHLGVEDDSDLALAVWRRVSAVLPEEDSFNGWNDEEGRTQEEVVEVLRRAARLF